VVPVVVVVAGALISAGLGQFAGYLLRWLCLAAVMGVPLAVVLLRTRRNMRRPPHTGGEAHQIMRCMDPMARLPALATLASSFALCTRWHCSVPGATWPNRNFAHAGTSDGTVDIEIGFYTNPTVFHRLSEAGRSWRIYRDPRSLAQVMAFEWMIDDERLANWSHLDEFAEDVRQDRLAAYSFIEPSHDGARSSSQHPGNNEESRRPPEGGLWDFERGENLIVEVYEALRANPDVFARTLLVITYDEHGGFYDHVPPPTDAVEPEPFGAPRRSWMPRLVGWFVEQPESRFRFTMLGPRVPTVIVGPRVPAAWVDTCFDHTAIPATVRRLFAPGTAPLSARERSSPTFDGLASLDPPRADLPDLGRWRRPEALARGGPWPPAAAGPPGPPADEFTRQLRELGRELRAKLGVAARGDEASTEDVAQLFTARADAARRRGG
jgi:phospholipase C